jgi:hypothetical protein
VPKLVATNIGQIVFIDVTVGCLGFNNSDAVVFLFEELLECHHILRTAPVLEKRNVSLRNTTPKQITK